ncbi:unnamed protein product [marine sediment metagenome]|uniref:Uncharacterized protein n=1 Tax=marine sediment metagenome TaxID=412755 RepID=X0TLE2_9ZZZZ
MAVPFPYPDNNITGIVTFLQYVNGLTVVGNTSFLGAGMLIIIGFVSFLSTKSYRSDKAFGFAGFITLISAIFLRFMELINDAILVIVIVIFIISVVFLMRERNVEEFGT